jgi:hypothetical protein
MGNLVIPYAISDDEPVETLNGDTKKEKKEKK